jgi:hypothetical protein
LEASDRSSTSNTSRPYYYYAVTYEYEVAGQRYTGDRYSLGGGSTASQNYESRREARNAGEERRIQRGVRWRSTTTQRIRGQRC